jgi:hypothetical protein
MERRHTWISWTSLDSGLEFGCPADSSWRCFLQCTPKCGSNFNTQRGILHKPHAHMIKEINSPPPVNDENQSLRHATFTVHSIDSITRFQWIKRNSIMQNKCSRLFISKLRYSVIYASEGIFYKWKSCNGTAYLSFSRRPYPVQFSNNTTVKHIRGVLPTYVLWVANTASLKTPT